MKGKEMSNDELEKLLTALAPAIAGFNFRKYLAQLASDEDRLKVLRVVDVCWYCGAMQNGKPCQCTNDE